MPDYLSSLGGEDYKGYIIGVFTIAAALSRPISGKLADTIGRIPVMIFGGLVCVAISFMYPLFTTVFGLCQQAQSLTWQILFQVTEGAKLWVFWA